MCLDLVRIVVPDVCFSHPSSPPSLLPSLPSQMGVKTGQNAMKQGDVGSAVLVCISGTSPPPFIPPSLPPFLLNTKLYTRLPSLPPSLPTDGRANVPLSKSMDVMPIGDPLDTLEDSGAEKKKDKETQKREREEIKDEVGAGGGREGGREGR